MFNIKQTKYGSTIIRYCDILNVLSIVDPVV